MKDYNDIEFSLFENGLDFIYSALTNLINSENKYGVKYSVLHLCSGIELVFKYRLFKENWKLLFRDTDKAQEQLLIKGDFQSVDFKECIKRLRNNCKIEFNDNEKEKLKVIRNKRNKLEHFTLNDSSIAVKSLFVFILNLIINFINDYIEIDVLNDREEELLVSIRESLGELEEFVHHRWDEIKEEVKFYSDINEAFECPSCMQKSLVTDGGSKCLFCGYVRESEEVADDYIWKFLGLSEYSTVKDGGEYPKYNCIECGVESFILDIENYKWKCFECGVEYENNEVSFCSRCGEPYLSTFTECLVCNCCMENILNKN